MGKPKLYLAGPIASRAYGEAVAWRRVVAQALAGAAECLDPMRDKGSLAATEGPLGERYRNQEPLLTSRSIVARDYHDVRSADLILMSLPEASVGTLVELGWATALGVPVILWLPEAAPSRVRDHPFVRELAAVIVPTIDDAVAAVRSFLRLPS